MIENLIVAVIVIAAFAYVLRKFIFKKKSAAGGDCGTCDKCSRWLGGRVSLIVQDSARAHTDAFVYADGFVCQGVRSQCLLPEHTGRLMVVSCPS